MVSALILLILLVVRPRGHLTCKLFKGKLADSDELSVLLLFTVTIIFMGLVVPSVIKSIHSHELIVQF